MKKKRILDSDHALILKYAEKAENKNKNKASKPQKSQKWKKMSEELRAIVKVNQTTTNFGSN